MSWDDRVENAKKCPDNFKIPRVPKDGKIEAGKLILHNGIVVEELSYDGEGPRRLMMENRGVHEPQEEYIFQEVTRLIAPGSTMLELGSYWAFYSIWFSTVVKNARCLCVEPDEHNIRMDIENFAMNESAAGNRVTFERSYAGACDGSAADGVPVLCVDTILRLHNVDRLAILHADTQGHELSVLHGARDYLSRHAIDWIFLSTHSNELHRKCLSCLRKLNYHILCDAGLLETYSYDGLIVACRRDIRPEKPLTITLRQP